MTIGDLARYGATHLDGEYGSDPVLLSQSSWQQLHAPFLDDYARSASSGSGRGNRIERWR